jgi:hypothetical protein
MQTSLHVVSQVGSIYPRKISQETVDLLAMDMLPSIFNVRETPVPP